MIYLKIKTMIRNLLADVEYRIFLAFHHFSIMSSCETVQTVVSKKLSVARFGDGEFKWILGVKQESFQDEDEELSQRLKQILTAETLNCLICIPKAFSGDKGYNRRAKNFWHNFIRWHGRDVEKELMKNKVYGDTNFTRWYSDGDLNILNSEQYIEQIKEIWNGRNILIVEGELTRFGVGNDLLDNAKSVKRIIAPSKNAFTYYDEILESVRGKCRGKLVLVALGPTATVLAYDLSLLGVQTIDVGHLDVEYEWYLRGVHDNKIKIPGKYVNEAGGIAEEIVDKKTLEEYNKEIIAKVGAQS